VSISSLTLSIREIPPTPTQHAARPGPLTEAIYFVIVYFGIEVILDADTAQPKEKSSHAGRVKTISRAAGSGLEPSRAIALGPSPGQSSQSHQVLQGRHTMLVIRRQFQFVTPLLPAIVRPLNSAARKVGCPPILSPPVGCAPQGTSPFARIVPSSVKQGRIYSVVSASDPAPGSSRKVIERRSGLPRPFALTGAQSTVG
jgi:hypothetical protein